MKKISIGLSGLLVMALASCGESFDTKAAPKTSEDSFSYAVGLSVGIAIIRYTLVPKAAPSVAPVAAPVTSPVAPHPAKIDPTVNPIKVPGTANDYYLAFTDSDKQYNVVFDRATACDILLVGAGASGSKGSLEYSSFYSSYISYGGKGGNGGEVKVLQNQILSGGYRDWETDRKSVG